MLNFKVNGKQLAKFKYFMWRHEQMYLLWLEDIDIQTEDGMVYPYYKPLWYIERHPGQWIFNLNIGQKVYSLVFQSRAPYLAIEVARLASVYTEVRKGEEDED